MNEILETMEDLSGILFLEHLWYGKISNVLKEANRSVGVLNKDEIQQMIN